MRTRHTFSAPAKHLFSSSSPPLLLKPAFITVTRLRRLYRSPPCYFPDHHSQLNPAGRFNTGPRVNYAPLAGILVSAAPDISPDPLRPAARMNASDAFIRPGRAATRKLCNLSSFEAGPNEQRERRRKVQLTRRPISPQRNSFTIWRSVNGHVDAPLAPTHFIEIYKTALRQSRSEMF